MQRSDSATTLVPPRGVPLLDSRSSTIETLVDPIPPDVVVQTLPKIADDEIELEKGLKGQAATTSPEETGDCSWPVLIACVIIVSITQGWGFVFGIFTVWFKSHLLSPGMSDSLIVLLPTTQAMMMMFTCSWSGRLADRFGHKAFIVIGCLASVASVSGCSFEGRLRYLYASQAIQGLGAGLVYTPCTAILSHMWKRNAHFATSVVMACVPLYAFIAALGAGALLNRVGHRWTIFTFAGIHSAFLLPALFIILRRSTTCPARTTAITWIDRTLVKDKHFWFLAASVAVTAFGFLPPFVFITVYTINNVPGIQSKVDAVVVPLALLNLSACLGRAICAFILSRPQKPAQRRVVAGRVFETVILLAALSQLIWAFGTKYRGSASLAYGGILAYAVANGLVGGAFLSVLPTLLGCLFPDVNKAVAAGSVTIFAVPGCFFGAYIFNRLLHITNNNWQVSILVAGMFQLCGSLFAFLV